MATRKPLTASVKDTRPGSIVACLSDASTGRPAIEVLVSVYANGNPAVCECPLPSDLRNLSASDWKFHDVDLTGTDGCVRFDGLDAGIYLVLCNIEPQIPPRCVKVEPGCIQDECIDVGLNLEFAKRILTPDCKPRDCGPPRVNDTVEISAQFSRSIADAGKFKMRVLNTAFRQDPKDPHTWLGTITRSGHQAFPVQVQLPYMDAGAALGLGTTPQPSTPTQARFTDTLEEDAQDEPTTPISGKLTVSHQRRIAEPDGTLSFFVRLLDASRSIAFGPYRDFIDRVFGCKPSAANIRERDNCFEKLAGTGSKLKRLERELTDHGVGAYELLKTATEAFLLLRCCIRPCREVDDSDGPNAPIFNGWPVNYQENPDLGDYRKLSSAEWQNLFCAYLGSNRLPYIQRVIDTAFPGYEVPAGHQDKRFCNDVLVRSRVDNPCFVELIWNYWHEEGMLVQSINAVSRRFQNQRGPGERDPLAHMEIDPLRPLNNILWGYVEDERNRLSIRRRAHEYQHHYGLNLYGKAVVGVRPADNRSKFIEAFHNLLNKCADYYRAKQDTTVDPDGYPILHAIQELNLILAQAAHNQFGDLPWTSRVEMLMQEWIMARPEMRDFLQSRAMVPYKEEWMPQVDTMKTMQGWSDVVVTHFRDLGVFGEQILLTIRWYNWYDVTSEEEAKGWADLLRAQIQSYIHAYRAVTGVDLSNMDSVDYTMPSEHLRKRLALQQRAR